LFKNRESERERMVKMFTNEELKEEMEARRHPNVKAAHPDDDDYS
jgi:hypothetical protein